MSYSRSKSVNFGLARAGLATVGYTLYPGGVRTTSGVTELVSGIYHAAVTFPTSFSGQLVWDTGQGGSTAYAAEDIAPGTDEYLDAAISGLTAAGSALVTSYPAGTTLAAVYCTDEDIALRILDDFAVLRFDSQLVARGEDGVFASGSPWTLTSASVDFLAQGVHAGQVIHLTAPRSQFRNDGQFLAVSTVGSNVVTLRRLGKAAGYGQPPAPAAGLTGVAFSIATFDSQIDAASYDANKLFGIDPNKKGQEPSRIYDPRALQQFTILTVVKRAYAIKVKAREGDFGLKLDRIDAELSELGGRLVLQWGTTGEERVASSKFNSQSRR